MAHNKDGGKLQGSGQRRAYQAPSLREYGSLRELVLGKGAGATPDPVPNLATKPNAAQ